MPSLLRTVLSLLLLAPVAFAAGRELAPRPLIPQSESFENLGVASAGGRFLTVWQQDAANGAAIYGRIADENGRSMTPLPFVIAETTRRPGVSDVDVAGAGDSFAVFYTDATKTVHMADVSLDGLVVGRRELDLPPTLHMNVAWDGERFLAAMIIDFFTLDRVRATFLERDGTVTGNVIPLDPRTTITHTAATGEGFIVFTSGRDHFAYVIAEDDSVTQVIAGDPASRIVSAPIGGGRLLVVYTMPDGHVRAAIWQHGAKVSEQEVVLDGTFTAAGLLPGDGRHLLVYQASEALFALHIDDVGTPLSDPLLVQSAPVLRVADGASNGNTVVVPHQHGHSTPVIASVSLRADGSIAASETLSMHPAPQSHVVVGAGGGSMLAVWNEANANTYETRIRTATINRDFEPQNVRELVPTGSLAVRKIAWNGTEYLIVYHGADAEELFAARLEYDGKPVGEPTLLGRASDPRAAVTWAGDRWAVAWVSAYGEGTVHYRTLSRGGFASPPRELDVTQALAFDVALAFDGRNVHLGWVQIAGPWYIEPPPQGHAVFTTRLRRTGHLLDAVPLAIPAESPRVLAMACNGEQLIVVVDESERTRLHVVPTEGRQMVSTRTLFDAPSNSDVTWDGWDFVAALAESAYGGRSFLRVWRLGDDGSEMEGPRITPTLARKDRKVSVAASPSYAAVVGMQESDAALGERAVIYAEREMYHVPDP